MTTSPGTKGPLAATVAVTLLFATLVLVVFSPDALYSGDIGIKFVQARSLLMNDWRSMTLAYPGEFLDPSFQFFPFRRPFMLETPTGIQTMYPLAVSILFGPFFTLGGTHGAALLSVICAGLILWFATRLHRGIPGHLLVILLGVGTPLWFYATSPWEHAAALALGTSAFAVALSGPGNRRAVLAGILLGCGSTLREESLLLLPGLLAASWFNLRNWRPLVSIVTAVVSILSVVMIVEVAVYGRPFAAHASGHLQFLGVGFPGAATIDPQAIIAPGVMTWRDRWDIVVNYWLFSDTQPLTLLWLALGIIAAHLWMRWRRSPLIVLLVMGAILAVAVSEWTRLYFAPRWIAGLFRLSPVLLCAFLPAAVRASRPRVMALVTAIPVILIALATTNTAGGKSLGPRLLLPIVPFLAIAAWDVVHSYIARRRESAWHTAVAVAGLGLLAVSVALQLTVMLPAWAERNREDAAAMAYLRQSEAQIIVADDPFTVQLLFPLYFDKVIYLADSPELAAALSERLRHARVRSVLVASRRDVPSVTLEQFNQGPLEKRGRMAIQTWVR